MTLTPQKLAALNIVVATLLGLSIAWQNWWLIIPCTFSVLIGWNTSNPKYWVTLPKKDYEEEVE